MKARWTALVVLATAGTAAAQPSPGYPQYGAPGGYGGGGQFANPYSYGPTNPYNRTNQPLSPYLNLLRGGNPAVNYSYGVRPGTTGSSGGFGGAPMFSSGAQRGAYFPPQLFAQQDQPELPVPGEGYVLPPAGHPVLFNNTLGYYPGPFGQRSGQARAGLAGAGGSRPAGSGTTRR